MTYGDAATEAVEQLRAERDRAAEEAAALRLQRDRLEGEVDAAVADREALLAAARALLDRCIFRNGLQFSMQKGFHQALHALWELIYPEAWERSRAAQEAHRG